MNGEEVKKRKIRSDKKRDIKPTISLDLKNCIYRLSYITNIPVKDIAEILCTKGLQSRKVIDYLAQFFRRDYEFKSTLYLGQYEGASLQVKYQSGRNERITTRFPQDTYNYITALAYALDVTPSKATSFLLDASVKNTSLSDSIIKLHLSEQLDNSRMNELKQVLKYINENNPYNEELSWMNLISLIMDEVKDNTMNLKLKISSWIDRHK